MRESVHTNTSIWSKGMMSVIAAQFLSAFGDNALLFATTALLKSNSIRTGASRSCKWCLWVLTFFCPFVGQVADSFAKGRVMMFANGLKLLGRQVFASVLTLFWGTR